MSKISTCGWDIGGAHVKVACLDADGRVVCVEQFPAPLWQGADVLGQVLVQAARELDLVGGRHALTMTGELADCFIDRVTGVTSILTQFTAVFPPEQVQVYAGEAGFVETDEVQDFSRRIASANWRATSSWVASQYKSGVLVDIGSTTTDVIPFRSGSAITAGATDFERLRSGELLYTGTVRTPVMALVRRVPYGGQWQPIIAELFATMADVYRLTGDLKPHHDLMDTADGRGKTVEDSARRLARMLGLDFDPKAPLEEWVRLARHISREQIKIINEVLFRIGSGPARLLVGAGSGRFLVQELARYQGCEWVAFDAHLEMDDVLRDKASDCAAAVAVAQLARRAHES